MLECAIHPITYRSEGILATVVKTVFYNITRFEAVPVLKCINQYRSIPNILCNLFYRWKRCIIST